MLSLNQDEDGTISVSKMTSLIGMRYDQILTSSVFNIPVARDKTTESILEKLRNETRKVGQGKGDKKKLKKLSDDLRARSINTAEDEAERQTQERLIDSLDKIQEFIKEQDTK